MSNLLAAPAQLAAVCSTSTSTASALPSPAPKTLSSPPQFIQRGLQPVMLARPTVESMLADPLFDRGIMATGGWVWVLASSGELLSLPPTELLSHPRRHVHPSPDLTRPH